MARGFIKEHKFDQHFVMGLHVRAGNGEVGDFTRKGRELDDLVSSPPQVGGMKIKLKAVAGHRVPGIMVNKIESD